MVYLKSTLFGVVAGVLGAAAWAAIAYFSGYEVGWVAWGIGALVGFAVRAASAPDVVPVGDAAEDAVREIQADSDRIGPGILAAIIAMVAVALGKFGAVMLLIGNMSAADFGDEELLTSYLADEIVQEYLEADRAVAWPAGVDPAYAGAQSDYPADVWSDAAARWRALSSEEQEQFRAATMASVQEMFQQNAGLTTAFAMFGMMDLLWFGLAAWTAFKLGASGSEE